jgi:hypothetical protein
MKRQVIANTAKGTVQLDVILLFFSVFYGLGTLVSVSRLRRLRCACVWARARVVNFDRVVFWCFSISFSLSFSQLVLVVVAFYYNAMV